MALISIADAAKRCGLSPTHLRRLAHDGTLKAQRFGTSWAIDERSLDRYLARERRPGPKPRGRA